MYAFKEHRIHFKSICTAAGHKVVKFQARLRDNSSLTLYKRVRTARRDFVWIHQAKTLCSRANTIFHWRRWIARWSGRLLLAKIMQFHTNTQRVKRKPTYPTFWWQVEEGTTKEPKQNQQRDDLNFLLRRARGIRFYWFVVLLSFAREWGRGEHGLDNGVRFQPGNHRSTSFEGSAWMRADCLSTHVIVPLNLQRVINTAVVET